MVILGERWLSEANACDIDEPELYNVAYQSRIILWKMPIILRSDATHLLPKAICEIVKARGTENTVMVLAKNYRISHSHIYEIWQFATTINN
ncbi:11869_t:CDS:2 [Entrophospora sp. SA101]|nr:11869_t:CDS:2 [Entrophospora sp. SA101]